MRLVLSQAHEFFFSFDLPEDEGTIYKNCIHVTEADLRRNLDEEKQEKPPGDLPSLKLTASLHLKMDGWQNDRFLLGWRNLAGANC